MEKRSYCIAVAVLACAVAMAQDDGTRQLWNPEFAQKRPPGKQNSPSTRVQYHHIGPVKPVQGSQTMVGVTLWRLRAPQTGESSGARLLTLEKNGAKRDTIPERVNADTVLAKGDHVRISVELPADSYLYVVDRERFSDGTTGDAYLIYPNRLTRPGDNRLTPGRQIEIPDRRDEPNYFTITPSRGDQSAELLSLIIVPQALTGFRIGDEYPIVNELYATWEKKWAVQAEPFEQDGSAGRPWTAQENEAGGNGAKLTQDDAMPQTLYRVNVAPGSPMVVQVPLRLQ